MDTGPRELRVEPPCFDASWSRWIFRKRTARLSRPRWPLAGSSPASIVLLHVIETIQDVPFEELEAFYGKLRAKAEEALQKFSVELRDKGFSLQADIVFGKRGPEILLARSLHVQP